jgi:hypothetical protein
MRQALSDGSVSQTSVRPTRVITTGSHDEPVDPRSSGGSGSVRGGDGESVLRRRVSLAEA